VTENDFDAVGILLGDRRKLQREIARRQLWPDGSPLPTPDELAEFTQSRDEGGESGGLYFFPHIEDVGGTQQNVCSSESRWRFAIVIDFLGQVSGHSGSGSGSGDEEMVQGSTSDSVPTFELDSEMQDIEEEDEGDEANPSYLSGSGEGGNTAPSE